MSNLEDIDYGSVTTDDGLSYHQFRKTLKPIYYKVWVDILLGYAFLLLPLIACYFLKLSDRFLWFSSPLLAIWFGYVLAYIHLFIHEAAHFNIYPDKKKNDVLANWCLCSLFALDIKKYRSNHWQHHLHLATPDDKEISYFNALSLRFIVRVMTGLHTLSIIRKRKETVKGTPEKGSRLGTVIRFVVGHGLFICLSLAIGGWPLALAWAAAVAVFFPAFATLRQVLEHRDELAAENSRYYITEKRNKTSRLFRRGVLSNSFGAAGFNKHLIHHWDPQISYTRLNDVMQFLKEAKATRQIVGTAETTYLKVFLKLFFVR